MKEELRDRLMFRAFGWTGDVANSRVRLLKIKHALLGRSSLKIRRV